MLRVKIDVSTLDSRNLTGIGNYIRSLIQRLERIPDLSLTGSYRLSRVRKKKLIQEHVPGLPLKPYFPGVSDYTPGYDVFHGPDFRIPHVVTSRRVVNIHDLAMLNPLYSSKELIAVSKKKIEKTLYHGKPDVILALSDFSKEEIASAYPEVSPRIQRIYLAADHFVPLQNKGVSPFDFPFILFVGSLERRKNIEGVIGSFEQLGEAFSEFRLVIAGGGGSDREWSERMIRKMKESKIHQRIHYLNYADDEMIKRLYSHASCFVFPSFNEGFGMPILESMVYSCPVVTSNRGAMKEVSGDAARHVDPSRVDEIAEGIREVLGSSTLQNDLIRKGHLRRKMFTWDTCAQETAEVYRRIC